MPDNIKFLHETHYTEGKKVSFKKFNLNLAGLLFLPDNFDEGVNAGKKYPAIVVSHPGGGVKEQTSSLYSWNFARAGYVALAFDAAYQGESDGEPRFLEDPTSRVEDIRAAIDYLVTLPYVDENRIGAMGICAGAGYTMSAVQTELRIKAAAGVSTWNIGYSARKGYPGCKDPDYMKKLLQSVADERTREARGGEVKYAEYVPEPDEIDENTSTILREASEYYRTPRCGYPTSQNKMLFVGQDKLAAFDAFEMIDTVSPRPLLFIVGSKADTIYFSEMAYEKAKEPKELYKIEGATHIDLYDKPEFTSQAVGKMIDFFNKSLN